MCACEANMLKQIVLAILLTLTGAATMAATITPIPAFAHPPNPCSGR